MKIVVDIAHFPHLNFFRNAVSILQKERHIDIDLIIQPRGNLASIVNKEYPNLPFTTFGGHRKSLFGKAANILLRDMHMLPYLRRENFDVSTGVQASNLSHVSYLLRKPSVVFDDDAEFKLTFYPYKFFATHIVVPHCIPIKGKTILKYRGFKELAYLHPHYYTPDQKCLNEYGLKPQRYVFIREVTNTTTDYRGLKMGQLSEVVPYLKDADFEIVLSLEEKQLTKQFEDDCIILNEPVRDIYSLLHFAAFTLSSGDTMARESCLTGTPAIYTGKKSMAVNKELEKKGCFFKVDNVSNVMQQVKEIIENDIKKETEYTIQKAIKNEWEDTTQVIIDVLLSKLYKDESIIEKYKMEGGYNGK